VISCVFEIPQQVFSWLTRSMLLSPVNHYPF
jgi:hypothetical protein